MPKASLPQYLSPTTQLSSGPAVKKQLLGGELAHKADATGAAVKPSWLSRHMFKGRSSAATAEGPNSSSTTSASANRSSRCSKFMDLECFKDRYVPLDKSSVFFLQALVIWMALCLPGNIVTFVIYQRVALQQEKNQVRNQKGKESNTDV